ncbi:MAG: FAD-dependent oxidoreductase, partial [bacterium]
MKIVIVGGVAGGASTAARLRRLNEDAEIIILERSGYISYANCGLPYYIGGVIEDEEDLTLQTPQSFYNRFRIDARVHHEAVKINREQKTVAIHDLANDRYYEESYDKLVLAPGATAIKPPLPGIDHEKIVTLRTVEDTLKIRKMVVSNVKSAIVVGGGFIGVEAAENLKEMGIDVTLIDQAPQVLSQLDEDMISFVHAHMKTKGIRFMLGTGVTGFEETDEGIKVLLNNQMCAEADLVLLAIGVVPDSHLAKEAGLALDVRNSIKVNEHMQTSDPDIYAVGDAVAINHL